MLLRSSPLASLTFHCTSNDRNFWILTQKFLFLFFCFLYISFFHKHFHRFEVSPLLLEFINSDKVILFIINSDRFLLHRFLKRADHLRLDPVSIIQYFCKLLRHDCFLILCKNRIHRPHKRKTCPVPFNVAFKTFFTLYVPRFDTLKFPFNSSA